MAISVDRIHKQYNKENDADFDFDVVEESKDFQKLSLTDVPRVPEKESKEFQRLSVTDNMPPQPQVPKCGKPLEQKPAGDFLYQNITNCLAPETFSPYLTYLNNRPKVVMILDEKPKENSPTTSTYSPFNPNWDHKWDFELPKTYEEYVALKSSQVPSFYAQFISDK